MISFNVFSCRKKTAVTDIVQCFLLQEENSSDSILTPVKEEVIKPEISIDEDMLVVHNDSLGLDQFF